MKKIKAATDAAAALKDGMQLGFSFSGGGFFLPYFVGVAKVLQAYKLLKEGTPVAGSSAGSLIAGAVACGLPLETVLKDFLESANDCRKNGTERRLTEVVRGVLERSLPPDAHVRASGVAHIGVTRVYPYLRHKMLTSFASREELISALLASCHIPRYSNGAWVTRLANGKLVMDGDVTQLIPVPKALESHTHFVKVSCFPVPILKKLPVLNKSLALTNLAIHPDPAAWPWDMRQTLMYALSPHTEEFLADLVEMGAKDTMQWVQRVGLHQDAAQPSAGLLHHQGAASRSYAGSSQQDAARSSAGSLHQDAAQPSAGLLHQAAVQPLAGSLHQDTAGRPSAVAVNISDGSGNGSAGAGSGGVMVGAGMTGVGEADVGLLAAAAVQGPVVAMADVAAAETKPLVAVQAAALTAAAQAQQQQQQSALVGAAGMG